MMVPGIISIDNLNIDNEVDNMLNICPEKVKECYLCGKLFVSNRRTKCCKREHHRICECCGSEFVLTKLTDLKSIPKTCSKQCANKLRISGLNSTIQKKYGVDNVSQVPEIHQKQMDSLESKRDEITKKRNKTMINRYGVLYPMQSEELRTKIQNTNIEKYGCKNPAQNDEIKKKISQRNSSPEVLDKYLKTALDHYGVPRPSMCEEVKMKMISTCQEKYGVDWASQSTEIKEKTRETVNTKYGVDSSFQIESNMSKISDHYISNINREVAKKLLEKGIETEFEFYVEGKSYDLHMRKTNIFLEIDPSYTHNCIGNHYGMVRDQFYHLERTKWAEQHGFRCIHIFDWDDLDKILNIFTPKEIIYARKCEIKEISKDQAYEFEELYDIKGKGKNQEIYIGLFYENELIEVITFGTPKQPEKYQWELMTVCSKWNVRILGGASKLFQYFIKNYNPESIITYCDISKFTGDVFEKLGMNFTETIPPQKIWSYRNKYICDDESVNEQSMLDEGWLPVYDCGQKVFTWKTGQ